MIEYLSEIPLPGRMLVSPTVPTEARSANTPSLGFIAGAENRLVASAVNQFMQARPNKADESTGRIAPKLLALFGPSGTGKTHLARGLVHYWNARRGAESAVYLTAGDFYRHLLDAIKHDAVVDFRGKLRSHELLAIDDLDQLRREDYVSQELRSTLDACEENSAAVIVTSRRPANTLANIPSDVRSRLSSGLILQLAPPENAARVRIIRRLSETLGRPLPEHVANKLAAGVPGTANDVFGAVFELCAAGSDARNGGAADPERLLAARAAPARLAQNSRCDGAILWFVPDAA